MTEDQISPPYPGSRAAASDVRTAAKGGVVQFLGIGINRGLSLAFVAVAIRLLGPAGFGLYRQVEQLLMMTGGFAGGGFDYATLRSVARARGRGEQGAVRGAVRVGAIGATAVSVSILLLLLIFANPIGRAFAEQPAQADKMAFLLRIGAIFIPLFALMQVLRLATQAYKTVVPSVIIGNLVQPVVMFFISIGALAMGFGVVGAVTGLVVSVGFGFLAGAWFLGRMHTSEERLAPPHYPIREMLKFAVPQSGVSLFRLGGMAPPVLLLGLFSTDRQVGLFSIGNSLQSLALIFPRAMLTIWSPMVADLHGREQMQRLGALYQTINRWVASLSFFIIAALVLQPEFFVHLLGGESVADAAMMTSILALGTLFAAGTGPCGQLITMTGYPVVNLVNSIVAVLLYVGAAWWLVPTYGGVGMAAVDSAIMVLLNLTRVVEAKILTGIQPFDRSFLKPIGATLAASVILFGWRYFPSQSFFQVLTGVVLAGVVYFAVLLAGGVAPEDRIVLKSIRARLTAVTDRSRRGR